MNVIFFCLFSLGWSSFAFANSCLDRYAAFVPALKEAKFTETGKGEKDYYSSSTLMQSEARKQKIRKENPDKKVRELLELINMDPEIKKLREEDEAREKLYRSNDYAQLVGPWGSNTITSIAKASTKQGEHNLYRHRNGKAELLIGLDSPEQVVIQFDNSNCRVEKIRYYTTKKSDAYVNTTKMAHVESGFCEFVKNNNGSLARLPKDFDLFRCEDLMCGQFNRQMGSCFCNKAPMTEKTCCADGKFKPNPFENLHDEYAKISGNPPPIEELSAEFTRASMTQCQKWKPLLEIAGGTSTRTKAVGQ